jgi:aryl-alcohol dehydrogenase-like predicted oxidoreductase
MEYRVLGKTGVEVSALCFGTMSFGDTADEATSAAMFNRCREVGINFFDCANVYAGGRSEEILGRLIADCRDEVVITSKVASSTGGGRNQGGMSRRHIMQEVEKSLRRLNTDRIDVYFIHKFDPNTPIADVVRTLDDLQRQGKILYPAVSNWAAWQIATALGVAAYEQLAPIACIQPMYNLVKRQAEVEILPLAAAENIGVIPYSPLGGGLLTGKYTTSSRPEQGRIVDNKMYSARYGVERYYEIAEQFADYASTKGYHPVTLAVTWVMTHPAVTSAIIGARNLEQLEPSLAAASLKMALEWRDEITALSDDPPPAHDRLEEAL